MKKSIYYTSELTVLIQLLQAGSFRVIVHDPENKCKTDDGLQFITNRSKDTLRKLLVISKLEKTIVFNLSQETIHTLDTAILVEFHNGHTPDGIIQKSFNYICNRDESMRWLYPSGSQKPLFLSFYNFNYWKANLYKFLVKTAFAMKMSWLVPDGKLYVYTHPSFQWFPFLDQAKEKAEYAIFSGTAGPNRKVVIAEAKNNQITHFIKLGLTDRSVKNIIHEAKMICSLGGFENTNYSLPKATIINAAAIGISSVQKDRVDKQSYFSTIHANFLKTLYNSTSSKITYKEAIFAPLIEERLNRIASHPQLQSTRFAAALLSKLSLLHQKINRTNPRIPIACMHGDFTPWNCVLSGQELSIFDWELAATEHPILFDLFHYVIQSQVFTKRADCEKIELALKNALELPASMDIVSSYKVDVSLHFQLYLLLNTSYYLDLYLNQQNLHQEAFQLFSVWNYFLSQEIEPNDIQQYRINFIKDFFSFLTPLKYVVLKNAGKPIATLSMESDIDILINKTDKESIINWIYAYVDVEKIKCIRKSFMTTLQLFFLDNSFLSIDLLHEFHRKEFNYIEKDILLTGTVVENDIKILPSHLDYLYIFLFYQLNYSDIPEKYTSQFLQLNESEKSKILVVLKEHAGVTMSEISKTFAYKAETRKLIVYHLSKQSANKLLKKAGRYIAYQGNVMTDLIKNRGFVLTFSGVDGAGKSTILFEIKDMLQKKYRRKVVIIRHRPSLLPIISALKYGKEEAEKRCVESLPRQGTNKSFFSSLARFAYYYSDYIFGQVVVYFKYILRGYVVLYDRYYFDFIVDSKRSNISINKGFIKKLYRFVFKPQLNFFLYAKPEIILQRKKELSAGDITSLTSEYKHLFHELGAPPQYMCIENIEKAKTIYKIEHAVIQLQ